VRELYNTYIDNIFMYVFFIWFILYFRRPYFQRLMHR
jgi:hypothetical protein